MIERKQAGDALWQRIEPGHLLDMISFGLLDEYWLDRLSQE